MGKKYVFRNKENKTNTSSTDMGVKEKRIRKGRLRIMIFWLFFLSGFSFAVFKHFTAVDTHTIVERETIRQEIIDVSAVESFVDNFARSYFTWDNTIQSLDHRKSEMLLYMTEALANKSGDNVKPELHDYSTVSRVQIWSVEQSETNEYCVWFTVEQRLGVYPDGKENEVGYTQLVSSYQMIVHKDHEGDMVIISNPTLHALPKKSQYEPEIRMSDNMIAADTARGVTEFLTTFFRLYPTISDREMEYYVHDNALQAIEMERFEFKSLSGLVINSIEGRENQISVSLTVEYTDLVTDMLNQSQYDLLLEKGDNWKIVSHSLQE